MSAVQRTAVNQNNRSRKQSSTPSFRKLLLGVGLFLLEKKVELKTAYRRFTLDREGMMVLVDILEESGVFKGFLHQDPTVLAQLEGRRQVGLHILSSIKEYCPEKFSEIFKKVVDRANDLNK